MGHGSGQLLNRKPPRALCVYAVHVACRMYSFFFVVAAICAKHTRNCIDRIGKNIYMKITDCNVNGKNAWAIELFIGF